MDMTQIADYARQLREAHGVSATQEAARKASEFEQNGDSANADIWRRVEAMLKEMQGPRES